MELQFVIAIRCFEIIPRQSIQSGTSLFFGTVHTPTISGQNRTRSKYKKNPIKE